jgi:cytidylate kinase
MALDLKIIGISGTNGAGKDAVGLTLADRHSYLFVSVTDLLRAELNRRGLPVDRVHLRELSAEWRRQHGYGVLVDRAIEEFDKLKGRYVGVAIASLRNPAEADRIHELGGVVLWIDADAHTRYERIQNNAEARARAGEDSKTFEEFLAEEQAEMINTSGDSAALNMSEVKKRADIILDNDQTNLAEFQNFITEQLFGIHRNPPAA